MRRREIGSKLERIIDFAGVREFIDTPVKHYSSGMYLRLGFSIAAHLDPDILLLDEVLAVGDAAFQVKCLDRIKDLHNQGRTIDFISHDQDFWTTGRSSPADPPEKSLRSIRLSAPVLHPPRATRSTTSFFRAKRRSRL